MLSYKYKKRLNSTEIYEILDWMTQRNISIHQQKVNFIPQLIFEALGFQESYYLINQEHLR